jgi:hypothetical protein
MPFQLSTLTLSEFNIMRNAKVELLRLQNPHLVPLKEEPKGQTGAEQMQTIYTANIMFGGSS